MKMLKAALIAFFFLAGKPTWALPYEDEVRKLKEIIPNERIMIDGHSTNGKKCSSLLEALRTGDGLRIVQPLTQGATYDDLRSEGLAAKCKNINKSEIYDHESTISNKDVSLFKAEFDGKSENGLEIAFMGWGVCDSYHPPIGRCQYDKMFNVFSNKCRKLDGHHLSLTRMPDNYFDGSIIVSFENSPALLLFAHGLDDISIFTSAISGRDYNCSFRLGGDERR